MCRFVDRTEWSADSVQQLPCFTPTRKYVYILMGNWWITIAYKLKPGPKFSLVYRNMSISPPCHEMTTLYHELFKMAGALKVLCYFKNLPAILNYSKKIIHCKSLWNFWKKNPNEFYRLDLLKTKHCLLASENLYMKWWPSSVFMVLVVEGLSLRADPSLKQV